MSPNVRRDLLPSVLAVLLLLACAVLISCLDDRPRQLLWNTCLLAAGSLAISIPLGTLAAVLLVRTDLPGRRACGAILACLLFIPLYLQAAAWLAGFGLQGWYGLILAGSYSTPLLAGWTGAVVVHGLAAVPWVALIVGLGLWFVQPDLDECALLDAPAAKVFMRVTLPQAAGWTGVAAIWIALSTAGEMVVTDLFQVRTYAEELYTSIALGDPQQPIIAWPMALLTGLAVAAGVAIAARFISRYSTVPTREPWRFKLGGSRYIAAGGALLLMTLLAGVPLANLLFMSGLVVEREGTDLVRSWSGVKSLQMISAAPFRYRSVLGWSFLISGSAATLAVAASIVLAWISRRPGLRSLVLPAVVALCLAIPLPLVALRLIAWMNDPGLPVLNWAYDHSIAAAMIVQIIKSLPLAALILWPALRTVPAATLEAAQLEGAGPLAQLFLVALPQRWPAVVAAWLAAFAMALSELAATILVVPPGVTVLSIQIFELIHYGVDDRLAGLCLATGGVFGLVALGVATCIKRGTSDER